MLCILEQNGWQNFLTWFFILVRGDTGCLGTCWGLRVHFCLHMTSCVVFFLLFEICFSYWGTSDMFMVHAVVSHSAFSSFLPFFFAIFSLFASWAAGVINHNIFHPHSSLYHFFLFFSQEHDLDSGDKSIFTVWLITRGLRYWHCPSMLSRSEMITTHHPPPSPSYSVGLEGGDLSPAHTAAM